MPAAPNLLCTPSARSFREAMAMGRGGCEGLACSRGGCFSVCCTAQHAGTAHKGVGLSRAARPTLFGPMQLSLPARICSRACLALPRRTSAQASPCASTCAKGDTRVRFLAVRVVTRRPIPHARPADGRPGQEHHVAAAGRREVSAVACAPTDASAQRSGVMPVPRMGM